MKVACAKVLTFIFSAFNFKQSLEGKMKKRILLVLSTLLIISGWLHGLELNLLETFDQAWAPKAVEVSPDGQYAAVMNLEGRNFWLIDAVELEVWIEGQFPATPATGFNYTTKEYFSSYAEKPVEATFSHGGRYVWMSFHNGECVVVYDAYSNEQTLVNGTSLLYDEQQKVTITDNFEDTATTEYLPSISVGTTPKVITVTPDEKYACVANWHSYSVSIIEIETLSVVETVEIGAIVRGMAVTSDSKTLYVARMGGGGISVINLETLELEDTLWPSGYWNPRHLVLGSDDRTLYISDNRTGTVLKYDVIDEEVIDEIWIGEQARTISMTPDESVLFATSHGTSEIVAIDVETFEEIYRMDYYKPMGMSISPDGTQLWLTSYQGSYVSVYEIVYD